MQPVCQSATNTQDITQKHMPKCKNTADVIRQLNILHDLSSPKCQALLPQCSNYTNNNSDNKNNNNNCNTNSSNRLIIATVIALVRVMVLLIILIIVIIIVIVMGKGWLLGGLWPLGYR